MTTSDEPTMAAAPAVDALLKLINEYGDARYEVGLGLDRQFAEDAAMAAVRTAVTRLHGEGAAADRTALIVAATEQTLRTAANWLESDRDSDLLVQAADAVKAQGADEACCPVCDEIACDTGCPLETLRTASP